MIAMASVGAVSREVLAGLKTLEYLHFSFRKTQIIWGKCQSREVHAKSGYLSFSHNYLRVICGIVCDAERRCC